MPAVFRKHTMKNTAHVPEFSNKADGSGSSGCPTTLSSSSCSALLPCDELLWKRTYILLSNGTFQIILTAGSPLTLQTTPKSGQCVKQLHIWRGKTCSHEHIKPQARAVQHNKHTQGWKNE